MDKLDTRDKTVALTFDDGPNPFTTLEILRLLDQYSAKATFFLIGERCARYSDLVKEIVKKGHSIYAHGYNHIRSTPDNVIDELEKTEALLRQYRPTPYPYYIRLPGAKGHKSPAIHKALKAWNKEYIITDWTYSFRDQGFAGMCQSYEELIQLCDNNVKLLLTLNLRAGIILIHECAHGITAPLNEYTGPIITENLLKRLTLAGYGFTSL